MGAVREEVGRVASSGEMVETDHDAPERVGDVGGAHLFRKKQGGAGDKERVSLKRTREEEGEGCTEAGPMGVRSSRRGRGKTLGGG